MQFFIFFLIFSVFGLFLSNPKVALSVSLYFVIINIIAGILGIVLARHSIKSYSLFYTQDTSQLSTKNFYIILPTEIFEGDGTLKGYTDTINYIKSFFILGFAITEIYAIYHAFFKLHTAWYDSIFMLFVFSALAAIITFAVYKITNAIAYIVMPSRKNYSIMKIDEENINYDKLLEINKRVIESCNSLSDFFIKICRQGNSFTLKDSAHYSKRLERVSQELLPILEEQEYYKNDLSSLQDNKNAIEPNLIKSLIDANDNIFKYKKPFDTTFLTTVEIMIKKIKSEEFIIGNFSWYDCCIQMFNNENVSINNDSMLNVLENSIFEKMNFEIQSGIFSFEQIFQSIFELDSNESYAWHASLEHIINGIKETPNILTKEQRKDLFGTVTFSPETFHSLILNEKLVDYPFDISILNSINNNRWNQYETIIANLSNKQTIQMLNKYFYEIEKLGIVLSEQKLNNDINMVQYFNSKLNDYWNDYNMLFRLSKNQNFLTQMDDKTKRDLKGRLSELERDNALMEEARRQSKIKEEELALAQQVYESQRRAESYAREQAEQARVQARNSAIAADNARQAATHAKREADTIQREIDSRKYGNPFRWDTRL